MNDGLWPAGPTCEYNGRSLLEMNLIWGSKDCSRTSFRYVHNLSFSFICLLDSRQKHPSPVPNPLTPRSMASSGLIPAIGAVASHPPPKEQFSAQSPQLTPSTIGTPSVHTVSSWCSTSLTLGGIYMGVPV